MQVVVFILKQTTICVIKLHLIKVNININISWETITHKVCECAHDF